MTPSEIRLYCDASINETTGVVGWCYLKHQDGQKSVAEFGHEHSKECHETLAALMAVRSCPIGSKIHLHVDHDTPFKIVSEKSLWRQKFVDAAIYGMLLQAISERDVIVTKLVGGKTREFCLCDRMARKACGLNGRKSVHRQCSPASGFVSGRIFGFEFDSPILCDTIVA